MGGEREGEEQWADYDDNNDQKYAKSPQRIIDEYATVTRIRHVFRTDELVAKLCVTAEVEKELLTKNTQNEREMLVEKWSSFGDGENERIESVIAAGVLWQTSNHKYI